MSPLAFLIDTVDTTICCYSYTEQFPFATLDAVTIINLQLLCELAMYDVLLQLRYRSSTIVLYRTNAIFEGLCWPISCRLKADQVLILFINVM